MGTVSDYQTLSFIYFYYHEKNASKNNLLSNPVSSALLLRVLLFTFFSVSFNTSEMYGQSTCNLPYPLIVLPNAPFYCASQPITLTTNYAEYDGLFTFQWQSGTGASNNIILPSASGAYTYSVTATNQTNGCTYTASTVCNVSNANNCLPCANNMAYSTDVTINTSTLAIFISNTGSSYISGISGKTIHVTQNFVMDPVGNNPYTFNNCTFIFDAGVELTIPANKNIIFQNCELKGCTELWKGIKLLPNSRLELSNSCKINDMYNGIQIPNGATFKSTYCTYDRNYKSVSFNSNVNLLTANFRYNSFYCTAPTKPLSGVINSSWARYGVYFQNVASFSIQNCNFYSVACGIYAESSNIHVKNCEFRDNILQSSFSQTDMSNGAGIASISGSLFVEGNNSYNSAGIGQFHNCTTGVYTKRNSATILNGIFTSQTTGILAEQVGDLEVAGNTITTKRTAGIYIRDLSTRNYQIRLHDNQITLTAAPEQIFTPSYSGILVRCALLNPPSPIVQKCDIYCNAINVQAGLNGISLENASNTTVSQNTISFTPSGEIGAATSQHHGIYIMNVRDVKVLNNTISHHSVSYQSTAITDAPIGIRLTKSTANASASTGCLIQSNTINNIRTGVKFSDVNSNAILRDNSFGNARLGVYYTGSLSMPEQINQGNRWIGTYSYKAARHDGIPFTGSNGLQLPGRFITNLVAPYAPSINNIQVNSAGVVPSMWFSNIGSSTPIPVPSPTSLCAVNSGGGASLLNNEELEYDISVAESRILTADFEVEMLQQAKLDLYGKLLVDSIYLNSDYRLVQFKDSMDQTNAKAFYDLRLERGKPSSTSLQNQVQYAAFQIEVLIQDLNTVDSLLALNPNAPLLNTQRGDLVSSIASQQSSYRTLQDSLYVLDSLKANTLSSTNASLSTTSLSEENTQTITSIYLNSIALGLFEYSDKDLQDLERIASQCPLSGGPAVYEARAMYGFVKDTFYNDDAICLEEGLNFRPTSNDIVIYPASCRISPNPANSEVILTFDNSLPLASTLAVYDVLGRKIHQQTSLSESHWIALNVENWNNGMYIIRIDMPNDTYLLQRFNVIH